MIARSHLSPAYQRHLATVEASLAHSYCPHSGLRVAAGLCLSDGTLVTGVNVESDSYGLTLCAERTAIARAHAEGRAHLVEAVLVSATWAVSGRAPLRLSPCGACRQWIAELSQRLDQDLPVYCFWEHGEAGLFHVSSQLLPDSFSTD